MSWQGGVQSPVCRSSVVSRAQGRSSPTPRPPCEQTRRPTKENKKTSVDYKQAWTEIISGKGKGNKRGIRERRRQRGGCRQCTGSGRAEREMAGIGIPKVTRSERILASRNRKKYMQHNITSIL